MQHRIRKITEADRGSVFAMMRQFYSSPAVFTDGSDEIFKSDIDACLSDSPYIEGFVFECDGENCGYAMIAKSFSTEFGKPCIWIEDLFIKENFRNAGLGSEFFAFIENEYPDALFRLEVEDENEGAVRLYKKFGFDFLPYLEMKK